MSISIFKKAAAFVCGAATMLSLSAALFASAEGPMVFTAEQVYAKPGETVSYTVSLSNNSGYAASGLSLIFDERLEIQNVEGRYIKPVDAGPAASGLNTTLGYNSGKHQIGWSTMGSGAPKKKRNFTRVERMNCKSIAIWDCLTFLRRKIRS